MEQPNLTLTVKQLATRLQVSLPTAYSITEQRGFPLLRVGAKKLIPVAALERWIDEQVRDNTRQQKVGR